MPRIAVANCEQWGIIFCILSIFLINLKLDYHDVYMQTDVALLVDVFENFRKICDQQYGLDPAHYYTAPG